MRVIRTLSADTEKCFVRESMGTVLLTRAIWAINDFGHTGFSELLRVSENRPR